MMGAHGVAEAVIMEREPHSRNSRILRMTAFNFGGMTEHRRGVSPAVAVLKAPKERSHQFWLAAWQGKRPDIVETHCAWSARWPLTFRGLWGR